MEEMRLLKINVGSEQTVPSRAWDGRTFSTCAAVCYLLETRAPRELGLSHLKKRAQGTQCIRLTRRSLARDEPLHVCIWFGTKGQAAVRCDRPAPLGSAATLHADFCSQGGSGGSRALFPGCTCWLVEGFTSNVRALSPQSLVIQSHISAWGRHTAAAL